MALARGGDGSLAARGEATVVGTPRLAGPRQRLDALNAASAGMRLYRARRMLAELLGPGGASEKRTVEPHMTFRARNAPVRNLDPRFRAGQAAGQPVGRPSKASSSVTSPA